jgi:hypothetical protein
MSIASAFNMSNRDRKPAEPRASSHGRQAAKRDAGNQSHDKEAVLTPVRAATIVSQDRRAEHIPLRFAVGARMLGAWLDDKLAGGCAPESSRLLATRAQLIVTPTVRQELADNWLALLVQAREPSGLLNPRVPLVRSRIIGAQAQILALTDALLAPMPTSRGVAMASSLLSDGSGPIYYSACSADLDSTLLEIIARLDAKAA